MAAHDLLCTACGHIQVDVQIPVQVGARAYCAVHRCPEKEYFQEVDTWLACLGRLEPIPASRFSLFSDGDPRGGARDFTKFTTEVEDPSSPTGYRQATIGSLADIRRLEKESEQRERNGEGRKYVWRSYSQNRSNEDQHSFMADPSMKPAKHYVNQTPVTVRRGDPVTADHGTLPE